MKIPVGSIAIFLLIFCAYPHIYSQVPKPENISKITPDTLSLTDLHSPHFSDFKVEPKELKIILKTYHVVSKDSWHHQYSHISGGDRLGWIFIKDGTKTRWLVRPAGLAQLTYPDSHKVYLAKKCHSCSSLNHR